MCDVFFYFKNIGVNIIELFNEVEMNVLFFGVEDFLFKLIICSILEDLNEFMVLCDSICDKVKIYLNCFVLYFNMLELIDKGLGVGVYNYEV